MQVKDRLILNPNQQTRLIEALELALRATTCTNCYPRQISANDTEAFRQAIRRTLRDMQIF